MIYDNKNENENHIDTTKCRPRPRHGHKYTKYKMCLSMMMGICIRQHLSNIWSSIHEKIKQYWGWVKKKALLVEKCVVRSTMKLQ